MALPAVRHFHFNRSWCTHKTPVVIWSQVFRGKKPQKGVRRAFRWALVRVGPDGTDLGEILWANWHKWARARGMPLDYLCFDASSGTIMTSNQLQTDAAGAGVEYADPGGVKVDHHLPLEALGWHAGWSLRHLPH